MYTENYKILLRESKGIGAENVARWQSTCLAYVVWHLTWTVNERPIVSAILQTHAGVQKGLWIHDSRRGLRRHLHWSFIGALYALPFPSIAGVCTPATAWLLQAMTACTIARTIFSCNEAEATVHYHR